MALSVAGGPQGGANDSYLPEILLRWANWSLVAPRVGKHLSDKPADGLQSDQNNPPETDFPLQVAYAATPGTLPVLRYARSYRFRARAVDLAGNSVAFSSAPTAFSFQVGDQAVAVRPPRAGREPATHPARPEDGGRAPRAARHPQRVLEHPELHGPPVQPARRSPVHDRGDGRGARDPRPPGRCGPRPGQVHRGGAPCRAHLRDAVGPLVARRPQGSRRARPAVLSGRPPRGSLPARRHRPRGSAPGPSRQRWADRRLVREHPRHLAGGRVVPPPRQRRPRGTDPSDGGQRPHADGLRAEGDVRDSPAVLFPRPGRPAVHGLVGVARGARPGHAGAGGHRPLGTPLHVHSLPGAGHRPRRPPAPDAAAVHEAAHLPRLREDLRPAVGHDQGRLEEQHQGRRPLEVEGTFRRRCEPGSDRSRSRTTPRWARSRSAPCSRRPSR